MEDEYELVPLSPIRRMEKRLEHLEKAGTSTDMIRQLIDVVKTNQQIVDDVVKINSEMIKRVSELTENVNRVTNKIDEFMSRIEFSAEGETQPQEKGPDLQAKIDKLEKRIASVVNTASQRRSSPVPPSRPITAAPVLPRRPLASQI